MNEAKILVPSYYDHLTDPVVHHWSAAEDYRLRRALKYVIGEVLDVGCGYGEFMRMASNKGHLAQGAEVTEERAKYSHKNSGFTVSVANMDKGLPFSSDSIDTVTAMSVIEHINNPKLAVDEMLRVAKTRVIIIVPYNQKIEMIPCINCGKMTSMTDGHLHSFDANNIRSLVPNQYHVRIEYIKNIVFEIVPNLGHLLMRITPLATVIDKFAINVFNRYAWMMMIVDKD